jgi:hypothetical protein
MKQQHRAARKKLDYPKTTAGSRLAAKARNMASKLPPEQRREHFNQARASLICPVKLVVDVPIQGCLRRVKKVRKQHRHHVAIA